MKNESSSSQQLYYYHGNTLSEVRKRREEVIAPYTVDDVNLLDWTQYTDFGKGFYVHTAENRALAIQWAKEIAARQRTEWGVVGLVLTRQEFAQIRGQALNFHTKLDRPANAPILFGRPASWLEFVEHNRKIRTAPSRPGDNDWTNHYAWIRGPIWVPADSRLSPLIAFGKPKFPDHVHQIDWGRTGLDVLNLPSVKQRRFIIDKTNEHRPDPRRFEREVPATAEH